MKHLRLVAFLLLFATTSTSILSAQTTFSYASPADDYLGFKKKKKKKKKSDSEYSLKEHLWYGGGLALGFAGGNGGSVFGIGVSPMVGYKIVGPLSAGPRLSIFFSSEKYVGYKAFNLFDSELSAFVRVRAFKGLFFQGELGTISDQYITGDNLGQPIKATRTRPSQYLGIGYNFSHGEGGAGTEISLMYDFFVADDVYSVDSPLQYRLAFTFNF